MVQQLSDLTNAANDYLLSVNMLIFFSTDLLNIWSILCQNSENSHHTFLEVLWKCLKFSVTKDEEKQQILRLKQLLN